MDFQTQVQLLVYMMTVGFGLAAVFEAYRQCHRIYKFKKILLHFLDFVFWVMAALLVFAVLFIKAGGELRVYSFLFLGVGALLHYVFIRRITIQITLIIIRVITTIVNVIKWILGIFVYKPLLFIWNIAKKLWGITRSLWKLIIIFITTLVGLLAGMLHWTVQRCKNLFKKKK